MSKLLVSLKNLEQWFCRQQRILPWRNDPSTYRVWVSEIMLQQTQVITVVPYFERFMDRFPTVESLAHAPLEDVLFLWAGLGYYSRARNLHKSARKIVEQRRFPKNREEWLEVPGVGNYTAGAILSIAEKQPEPILDGNVERVLSRLRRVMRQKGDVEFKSRLWNLSNWFVKTGFKNGISPSNFNQALMELGAMICTPKKPKCLLCPISEVCKAYARGDQEAFPPKKKPKEWIQMTEELHCILDGQGKVLLRQRESGEWRSGLWDLLDQKPNFGSDLIYVGEVKTKYVVTRHKVQRQTKIWQVSKQTKKILQAAESSGGSRVSQWVSIEAPEVAVGSPLKKTLRSVGDLTLKF